ncbi:MAG: hypothetical protein ACR2PK_12100 [Acidimicrobiales bacterium]
MDLFTPGAGAAGQVHDLTPGVLPNGVFWTSAIPVNSFHVGPNRAQLRLRRLPVCDSFFFGSGEGVSAQVSCNVKWEATTNRQDRGEGSSAAPDTPGAFTGKFSDANCTARVRGRETGFAFKPNDPLDASGFYANFGEQRNGVFL